MYIRYSRTFALKKKAETGVKIQDWISVEKHKGSREIQVPRFDNGDEFLNLTFPYWLKLEV